MNTRICAAPGCKRAGVSDGRCHKHPRNNDSTTRHLNRDMQGNEIHKTRRWQALRDLKIRTNPICEHCLDDDLTVPARVVDHIKEVRDHPELAYTYSNLQSLCHSCHGVKTAKEARARNKMLTHSTHYNKRRI